MPACRCSSTTIGWTPRRSQPADGRRPSTGSTQKPSFEESNAHGRQLDKVEPTAMASTSHQHEWPQSSPRNGRARFRRSLACRWSKFNEGLLAVLAATGTGPWGEKSIGGEIMAGIATNEPIPSDPFGSFGSGMGRHLRSKVFNQ